MRYLTEYITKLLSELLHLRWKGISLRVSNITQLDNVLYVLVPYICICSNHGTEFTSGALESFRKEKGIILYNLSSCAEWRSRTTLSHLGGEDSNYATFSKVTCFLFVVCYPACNVVIKSHAIYGTKGKHHSF